VLRVGRGSPGEKGLSKCTKIVWKDGTRLPREKKNSLGGRGEETDRSRSSWGKVGSSSPFNGGLNKRRG